jgi:hypothetical protein
MISFWHRRIFKSAPNNRPHKVTRQSVGTVVYSSNQLYKLLNLLTKLGLYKHP